MILLDVFKVKKKNHSGNQKVVEKVHKEYWHTGVVFRFGGAIVGLVFSFFFLFFFKAVTEATELPVRKVIK